MKKVWICHLALLIALSLSMGCRATKSIKKSIDSTVGSMTSKADSELLAQVPDENRVKLRQAEFEYELSGEKRKLAEMKKDLVASEKKFADYEYSLSKKRFKEAEISVDIAKLEAIDQSGLGNKETSINSLGEQNAKKLRVQAECVKIQAKIDTTKLKIAELASQVNEQEAAIRNMEKPEISPTEIIIQSGAEEQEEGLLRGPRR